MTVERKSGLRQRIAQEPSALSAMSLHPLALLCWLGAVLVALSLTRNPLYLVLILLCIAIVNTALQPARHRSTPLRPLRVALVLILFSTLFNGLTVHYGDTILARLPPWLPAIGGTITLEALLYGALNGLMLVGFFTAFALLTATLPTSALIRLLPPALYPVAVVISIAVSFVPTTLQQIGQIREAQAVRGHRMQGWRSWLPLWLPLLVGGLERALQLAEAMVARGFGSSDEPHHALNDQIILVAGLLLVGGGWLLRLAWGVETLGIALMITGVIVVAAAFWRAGRRVPRTHYRLQRWRTIDSVVAATSALVTIVLLVPLPGIGRGSLFFYPYPKVTAPTFDTVIGIALVALLAPVLMARPTPPIQSNKATP